MSVPILFDRQRLGRARTRAARHRTPHDFLRHEAAVQAEAALAHITRSFPRMAVFGGTLRKRGGTDFLLRGDLAPAMLPAPGPRVVAHEEWLPFAEASLDAIVSIWDLHWVNDLPGALSQIRRALTPDGLFLAVMPGAETLRELRQSLALAESEVKGGIHPRIAPFPDVREAGALLQRAGFALPVASSESITATYPAMTALMHELRAMGENNMLTSAAKTFTPRRLFERAGQHYGALRDAEGRLPATFEFLTLMGWKST